MWLLVFFCFDLSLGDEEALALAKALYEQRECEQRLQMAKYGLALQGYPWRSGCVSRQHRWEKRRVLVPLLNIHEIFAYFIEA